MNRIQKSLVAITVAGLAVDAYIHMSLAGQYAGIAATLSQGQLFRMEAGAALIAIILLLLKPGRATAAFAALVAGGGTLALLVYYFINVGPIGPLPNMYDPLWYWQKVVTLIAQIIATAAAVALIASYSRRAESASEQDAHTYSTVNQSTSEI